MPFKQDFERQVNEEMSDNTNRLTPTCKPGDDMNIKKDAALAPEADAEIEDAELWEKKDRPPRFSALFGAAPLPAEEAWLTSKSRRTASVFVPLWVVILVTAGLVFLGVLVFMGIVVWIYDGLPTRLVASARFEQPAINVAPNFMLPQGIITTTVTIAASQLTNVSAAASTISSSNSISSTPASTSSLATSAAAAVASALLGISASASPSSSSSTSGLIVIKSGATSTTETLSELPPPGPTVQSTTFLTVDAAGSPIAPRPTVTSTLVLNPSQAAAAGLSVPSPGTTVTSSSPALAPPAPPTTLSTSVVNSSAPQPSPAPASSSVSPK